MRHDTRLLADPGYPYQDLSPQALDILNGPQPSFTQREQQQPPPRDVLADLHAGLQHLDWQALDTAQHTPGMTYAQAREQRLPHYEATVAEHYGTGPQPAVVHEPVMTGTGYPEGIVRGMLISGLWSAAVYYRSLDPGFCDDCRIQAGLCGFHGPRLDKALEYEDMHDAVTGARSDSAALYGVAHTIQISRADLGDIASPGSPLEALLLAQLDRIGGAR